MVLAGNHESSNKTGHGNVPRVCVFWFRNYWLGSQPSTHVWDVHVCVHGQMK